MGTCAAATAQDVFEAAGETLDGLGLRGLVPGRARREPQRRARGRDGVFLFAPLGQVLPRCRAIVHAGSHGTNAVAMHAGTPCVSVPVLFDQLWHGRRTQELGIGRLARHGAKRPAELRDAITQVGDR